MSTENTNASACWACRAPIELAQKICTNCQSWQNWRRYLNLSTATLSLLVALISVSSVTFAFITSTLDRKFADLIVSGRASGEIENNVYLPNLLFSVRNIGNASVMAEDNIHCYGRLEVYDENLNDYRIVLLPQFRLTSTTDLYMGKDELTEIQLISNGSIILLDEQSAEQHDLSGSFFNCAFYWRLPGETERQGPVYFGFAPGLAIHQLQYENEFIPPNNESRQLL